MSITRLPVDGLIGHQVFDMPTSALRERLRRRADYDRHPMVLAMLASLAPVAMIKLYTGEATLLFSSIHFINPVPLTWMVAVFSCVLLWAAIIGSKHLIASVWAEIVSWTFLSTTTMIASINLIRGDERWWINPYYVLVLAISTGGMLRVITLIPVVVSWYDRGVSWLLKWRWLWL